MKAWAAMLTQKSRRHGGMVLFTVCNTCHSFVCNNSILFCTKSHRFMKGSRLWCSQDQMFYIQISRSFKILHAKRVRYLGIAFVKASRSVLMFMERFRSFLSGFAGLHFKFASAMASSSFLIPTASPRRVAVYPHSFAGQSACHFDYFLLSVSLPASSRTLVFLRNHGEDDNKEHISRDLTSQGISKII